LEINIDLNFIVSIIDIVMYYPPAAAGVIQWFKFRLYGPYVCKCPRTQYV